MLSPEEQMQIISQATAEGYKGSFTELLQQAEQQQPGSQEIPPEQQQQSPPSIPPNTSLTSGANLQSTPDSTGGGLVQSYADTSPSIGDFDTGDGVRDVLYEPGTYESGGFKDTVQSVLNDGIYKLSDFDNYDLDSESSTSILTDDQMQLRLSPDKKSEGGVREYKNGGEQTDPPYTSSSFQISQPSTFSGTFVNDDIETDFTIPANREITGGIVDKTLLSLDKSNLNIKSKTLLGNFMKTQVSGEKIFSVPILEQSLSAAKQFGDVNLEASISRDLLDAERRKLTLKGNNKYKLKGTKQGKDSFTELELEHEPDVLSRALLIHGKTFGKNKLSLNLGYSKGSGPFGESGITGGINYTRRFKDGGVREYEHGGAHINDINIPPLVGTGSTTNTNSLNPGITGSFFTSPYQQTHNYGIKLGMNEKEMDAALADPRWIQEGFRNLDVQKRVDKASFNTIFGYNRGENLKFPNSGNQTFNWRGTTYGTELETEYAQRMGGKPLNTKPDSVAAWEKKMLLDAKNNPESVILGDTEDATIKYGSDAQRWGSTHPEANAEFNRKLQVQAGNMTTNEAEISAARYQYNTGIGGILNKEQQNLLMMDDRNQWELEQQKVAQKRIDKKNSPVNASTINSVAIAQSSMRFNDQSINTFIEGTKSDLFTHAAESTGMQFSNASQTASIKDPIRAEWDKIQFILNDPDLSEDAKLQYARTLPNSSTSGAPAAKTLGFNYMTTPYSIIGGGQTKNGTYEDFVELKGQIKAGKQLQKNRGMIYPTIDNNKMQMMTFGNMWAGFTPGGAQHKYNQLKDVYKDKGQDAMYEFAGNTSYMANQGLVGDAVIGAGGGGLINKGFKYAKPLANLFKPGVNVGRLNALFNPIQKAKYTRNALGQFQSSKNLSMFDPRKYQFNTGQGFKNMVTGRNIQTGMKLAPIESALPGALGRGVNTLRNTSIARGLRPVTQGLGVATDLFHLGYTPYFAKSVFEGGQDIYKGNYHKGTEKIVTNATEFFNPVSKPLQYSLEGYKIGRDLYSGHDASATARFFGGAKYRSASQFPKALATTIRKGDKYTGFLSDTDYINQKFNLHDYSILNSIYDPLYKRKGGFRLK